MKHTKGPWKMKVHDWDDYTVIFALVDGHEVEIAYEPHTTRHFESCSIVDPKGTEANMKLLAAAPDLLEALKKAVNDISYYASDSHGRVGGSVKAKLDSLRAIIKKAEGE